MGLGVLIAIEHALRDSGVDLKREIIWSEGGGAYEIIQGALGLALFHLRKAVIHQAPAVCGRLYGHVVEERFFVAPDAVALPGADGISGEHQRANHLHASDDFGAPLRRTIEPFED